MRATLCGVASLLLGWQQGRAGGLQASFEGEIRPLLESYCFQCHGEERQKGGVNLQAFTSVASLGRDPVTWETVARLLHEGEMPPDDKPQPTMEERRQLEDWIQSALEEVLAEPVDPGRVTLRRLSRVEYNRTIRDLLGVESSPADQFPADGGGGGGFDNNADTLFVPPILMERYLQAASDIVQEAASDRLFLVRAEEESAEAAAARATMEQHASRAFRRPAGEAELDRLMELYRSERAAGRSWEESVRQMVKALLISPHFLFRVELDQAKEGPYRIGSYEMASRLSYFLWSSMPDEELMRLAAEGRILEEEVLMGQVDRMIEDPKAEVFFEQFTSQWLGVDKLKSSAQPDPNRFKEYTVELRKAMQQEPVELFRHVMRENRSLLELLEADYTFVNGLLARHYGLEGVGEDAGFQKVKLPDRRRGGLLGMGAVLTLTSYPLRTSPVLRGKWVLEEVLGTPPPPPPPLVESLPADDRPREGLTFRQRLEKHREDPNCAACHKRMDPLGFALENFDAIGRWRTDIGGEPVDASAELPSGEKFTGVAELRKVILDRRELFLKNLAERMLAYALGRGLEYYDRPTVNLVAGKLREEGAQARVLVREIVRSLPFQYRRNDPIETGETMASTEKP